MPAREARGSAQPHPPPEIVLECAVQLRRIGDKVNSLECAEGYAPSGMLSEMPEKKARVPGKKARKGAQQRPSPTRLPAELEADCVQLRRIGDRLNFQQKLLNLISKLFNVVT
uniref:phorbol-12-myristate-13-acetate-induced protein 1 isoform X1 n=2 Tax=Jaculus jaculus TaxID=51337 RepID=UPI001E1B4E81|nr:phorbol-12-myristate-13-acetate-induced protein 1 isoform X1 [Jaculus jaculus]